VYSVYHITLHVIIIDMNYEHQTFAVNTYFERLPSCPVIYVFSKSYSLLMKHYRHNLISLA